MPQISLIIPTLNEAENLPLLLPRLAAALAGRDWEAVIVDDASRDATAAVCQELSKNHPIKFLSRLHATNGLSGAVLHGMAQASGAYFVVMDADLQHPPERIAPLLEPLEKGEADFTLGSRYIEGGGMAEKFGVIRRIISRGATLLARPFAGNTRDPMSGFFALRRETYQRARHLTPIGYKIGLELMCKCQVSSVREVPIHFGARAHGQSKLTLKEQYRYLAHLSRLYDYHFPRASPIAKFLVVLACSWLASALLYFLLIRKGLAPTHAAIASYPLTILITAVFHLRYTRTQRAFLATPHPWRDFFMISAVEWISCALVAIWASLRLAQPSILEIFFLSFGAAAILRYLLRKELLLDIRGLRKEIRRDELAG
jgi:dolichol-phosphate mannosyltransferase